ncbi:MAG: hypothetical protein JXR95_05300, partial [Deltaproteobacteria bacterium]|nr:hypothetical protein [Deltaproteobacteria bacterium]
MKIFWFFLIFFSLSSCGFSSDSGITASENCSNGIDDDFDGYIDCQDVDCEDSSFCISGNNKPSEICDNGEDDDGDSYIDCDDQDCFSHQICNTVPSE